MFGMDGYWYEPEISVILFGTGGIVSPGRVKLSNHDRKRAWNVKEPDGTSGGSSNMKGTPIGRFSALFQLSNEVQEGTGRTEFDDWEDFQSYLDSLTNGPAVVAVPIYHPDLARQRFTEVTIDAIYGMEHDGFGGATVRVDFIEYKPLKPAPVKKATAKSGSGGTTTGAVRQGTTVIDKPDPNAQAKAELAALLDQANRP